MISIQKYIIHQRKAEKQMRGKVKAMSPPFKNPGKEKILIPRQLEHARAHMTASPVIITRLTKGDSMSCADVSTTDDSHEAAESALTLSLPTDEEGV